MDPLRQPRGYVPTEGAPIFNALTGLQQAFETYGAQRSGPTEVRTQDGVTLVYDVNWHMRISQLVYLTTGFSLTPGAAGDGTFIDRVLNIPCYVISASFTWGDAADYRTRTDGAVVGVKFPDSVVLSDQIVTAYPAGSAGAEMTRYTPPTTALPQFMPKPHFTHFPFFVPAGASLWASIRANAAFVQPVTLSMVVVHTNGGTEPKP